MFAPVSGIGSPTAKSDLLLAARSFEIEAADAKTTVPDYKHDLFSGPRELSTDGHADTVANGCERTRVENLAGEASLEPLRHPAALRGVSVCRRGVYVYAPVRRLPDQSWSAHWRPPGATPTGLVASSHCPELRRKAVGEPVSRHRLWQPLPAHGVRSASA